MSLRVLVVEDHPDGAEACALLLGMLGHEVRLAGTCAEALAVGPGFAPDAAVVDLGLPDGDGCQLVRRLLPLLRRRPVLVAVTGFGHLEGRARAAGFDHYFLKPCDPERLVRALEGADDPVAVGPAPPARP